MASELEKTNLEAHVEISERRYDDIQKQINDMRERIDELSEDMDTSSKSAHAQNDARQKQMITIAGTIIGVLLSALIGTFLQLLK